jgi:hypothetical protein
METAVVIQLLLAKQPEAEPVVVHTLILEVVELVAQLI